MLALVVFNNEIARYESSKNQKEWRSYWSKNIMKNFIKTKD